MKHTRRKILGILLVLPISSVAFASELQKSFGKGNLPEAVDFDFESEMLRRLDEGTLNAKYYDFLDRHEVPDIQALVEEPVFARHKDRMTKEFIADVVSPVYTGVDGGGVVAANPLSNTIPPD